MLILLTDGNDTSSAIPVPRAAAMAAAKGVVIHTIGIGSTSGEPGYYLAHGLEEQGKIIGVAGIKKYVEQRGVRGQTLVAIDSGANVNFDRLRHVAERAWRSARRPSSTSVA